MKDVNYNAHALLRFGHRCSVVTTISGRVLHLNGQVVADQLYSFILTATVGARDRSALCAGFKV